MFFKSVMSKTSISSLAKSAAAGVASTYLNSAAQSFGSTARQSLQSAGSKLGSKAAEAFADLLTPSSYNYSDISNRIVGRYRSRLSHRERYGTMPMVRKRSYRGRGRSSRFRKRRYSRVSRRKSMFRKSRSYRRKTRTYRRSFRRIARSTGFYRRRRFVRPNARGSISSIYTKMIKGESLPYIGFGRCRMNQVATFTLPATTAGKNAPLTWYVNSLDPTNMVGQSTINYNGLYNLLYEQYLCLGVKLRLNIKYGPALTPASIDTNPYLWDSNATRVGNNGYWYIRYHYPGRYPTDTDNAIGIPMTNDETTDATLAARWAREIDFLQDKSVVYSRDGRTWFQSAHENVNDANTGLRRVTREVGTFSKDRGVNISIKFGFPKLYRMPQILNGADGGAATDVNPFWANIGSPPTILVTARLGYISYSYDSGGTPTLMFNPAGFNQVFKLYACSDWYCAFRRPTDTSTLRSVTGMLNRMADSVGAKVSYDNVQEPVPDPTGGEL